MWIEGKRLTMSKNENDVDVLIVGAGPVGLFLANECARRELKFRIVEAHATQSEHSKALAIFPRTMEIFDMAGLVELFLRRANRVTAVRVATPDRELAHMSFTPEETPYPFVAMVPQDVTEKLLVEHLHSSGGQVEYETSFVSGTQNDASVSVTLDHLGQRIDLTASYVVGCDGAHSTVRHLMNLPFEGAEYEDLFMLADIETNDAFPADEMQLCPNEQGPVAVFPMSATRRRIVAVVKGAVGEKEVPSLDLARKILRERAPEGIEARSLHWSSYFRIHHRQAPRLQESRIFIAGDAAHIHSPFGGQGMNTGLQDVWNLAWKLDLVLRGHCGHELLETYTSERCPVIKSVIETTDLLTRVMGTPSKLAQVLRNAFIPMVSRLAPFQHAFVQRLSELGVAYAGSPIVEGAGERYLDDSLRGGRGIRSRFLLMRSEHAVGASEDAARHIVESFGEVVELRTRRHPGVMLLRPDGYVAYSSASDEAASYEHVRKLLERQAASSEK